MQAYLELGGGAFLIYYGLKKQSGAAKWIFAGVGAYLLYTGYQGYTSTSST